MDTPSISYGVALAGTSAYVADTASGLLVIDVSDPQNPRIVHRVDTPGYARCVSVSCTHAYVADTDFGIQVVDISDPDNPQITGGIHTSGSPRGIAVSGALAYVTDWGAGLWVLPAQCEPASVGDAGPVPSGALLHAYPNPSRDQVRIHFETGSSGQVRASIHDPSGRRIRRLLDGNLSAGMNSLLWDGRDEDGHAAVSGIYLVRVVTTRGTTMGRFVLVR